MHLTVSISHFNCNYTTNTLVCVSVCARGEHLIFMLFLHLWNVAVHCYHCCCYFSLEPSFERPNIEQTNNIWFQSQSYMCSYASTCFRYRQFLFVHVLCCVVHSIWYTHCATYMNAFLCCCWNCSYLSFSSYRDNFIYCYCYYCSYCAANFTMVYFQTHFWKLNPWVRSLTLSKCCIYLNDDGIESHLVLLWHLMEPPKWLELHNCLSTVAHETQKWKFLNAMPFASKP